MYWLGLTDSLIFSIYCHIDYCSFRNSCTLEFLRARYKMPNCSSKKVLKFQRYLKRVPFNLRFFEDVPDCRVPNKRAIDYVRFFAGIVDHMATSTREPELFLLPSGIRCWMKKRVRPVADFRCLGSVVCFDTVVG